MSIISRHNIIFINYRFNSLQPVVAWAGIPLADGDLSLSRRYATVEMELQSKQQKVSESFQGKATELRRNSNFQLPSNPEGGKNPVGGRSQKEGRRPSAGRAQSAVPRSSLGIAALASGSFNITSNILFSGLEQQ